MENNNQIPKPVFELLTTHKIDVFVDLNASTKHKIGSKIILNDAIFQVIKIDRFLVSDAPSSFWIKAGLKHKTNPKVLFLSYDVDQFIFETGIVSYISLCNISKTPYKLSEYIHFIQVKFIVR